MSVTPDSPTLPPAEPALRTAACDGSPTDATLPPTPPAGGPSAPGLVGVPGYELFGELGRGGMGVVYRARQVGLNRPVALKMILSGGHASAADLARFRTEAEAIARLQHPNVVQVYEVGEQGGLPYFSLEFCGGGSLAARLDGTPWEPKRAAALVETLARAMEAAHARQIVHRDLKPANVLLADDGTPKVTDFGLAKQLDSGAGQTASGAILGTPSYMAPEQANGGKDIGPAADVYALGAILYELLTGRPPFRAATPLDTVLQVVSEEPVAPGRLNSKTPRDLETVCLKCLAKEAMRRYASAEALAEDLRRYQSGEPIAARPVGRLERGWRWCRRNPVVAGLLAAVVIVTAGGFTGTLWQKHLAEANAEVAVHRQAEAEAQREEQRRAVYAAHMGLIRQAWEGDQLDHVLDLLEEHRPRIGEPDLRGFEWYYWKRLLHGESAVVRLASEFPDGAILSADGSRFMSHGPRVWDVATGRLRLDRPRPPDLLRVGWGSGLGSGLNSRGLCLSRDGRRAAETRVSVQGPDSCTLTVVDVDSGRELYVTQVAAAGPQDVHLAFSPDGTRLAVVWPGSPAQDRRPARDGGLAVHDLAAGGPLFQQPFLATANFGLWGMPDNRRLIVSTLEQKPPAGDPPRSAWVVRVVVFDAMSGERLSDLPLPAYAVLEAVSPDGARLAVWDQVPKQLKVLDAATGRELATPTAMAARNLCFSPDGARLAGQSYRPSAVHVWDVATGAELFTFRTNANQIAFRSDPAQLVTLDMQTTGMSWAGLPMAGAYAIKTWDLAPRPERAPGLALPDGPDAQVLTQDGRRSVALKRKNLDPVEPAKSSPRPERLTPTEWHVSDDSGRGVARFDGPTEDLARYFGYAKGLDVLPTPRSGTAVLSPDGTKLAIGRKPSGPGRGPPDSQPARGPSGAWVIWDVDAGRELCRLDLLWTSTAQAFSADGRLFAGAHGLYSPLDGLSAPRVTVWDAATGHVVRDLPLPGFRPTEVALSPDGRRLVVLIIEDDSTVLRAYDVATGAECGRGTLPRRGVFGTGLVYSPDGRRLAATGAAVGSGSQEVYVWDAAALEREPRKLGHGGAVGTLTFSPDGRRLACLGGREIKVWDPATGQELLSLTDGGSHARFSADGHKLSVFDKDGRRTYDATPLPPELEAPDVADRLAPAAPPAEAAAQLDQLVLSPELKVQAARLFRLAPSGEARQGDERLGAGIDDAFAFLGEGINPLALYRPGQPEKDYEELQTVAEAQKTFFGDDLAVWFCSGGALYRLGRYDVALTALTRLRELEAEADPTQIHPATTAFLTMTYHRLGQADKAKEALAQLRRELAAEPFASGLATMTPAMRDFYAEPAALIEGKK
jgi:WD40 repeat protein